MIRLLIPLIVIINVKNDVHNNTLQMTIMAKSREISGDLVIYKASNVLFVRNGISNSH